MGRDLSSAAVRLPLSNGLDPNTREIDPNLAASNEAGRSIAFLEDRRVSVGPMPCSRCLLSGSFRCARVGGRIMHFREEPVTPVYRHWMCEQVGCNGELLCTGEGITRLSTRWKHRCGKCGHEDWADATYPRVAYLPIDAENRIARLHREGV